MLVTSFKSNHEIRWAFGEPYRFFFPLGILFLLCGILIWLPQIWNPGDYPVTLHKFLVLNGFVASFIAGFLMTAVPKFSKTFPARLGEVAAFFGVTVIGVIFAHLNMESESKVISALQVGIILFFLFSRIFKRKENPPYSFIFIFVGLFLWLISAVGSVFSVNEVLVRLHYEGAIAAIILGVGSRLIPGILGHVEIVSAQRKIYETPKSLISTVPLHFFCLIFTFVGSYFLATSLGDYLRAAVVLYISLAYWKLYCLPKNKSSLTISIWISAWLIVCSFFLKAIWNEGGVHAAHAFFINGIVLLSLLIGTRVLQSHGPQDNRFENWRGLYAVTFLVALASATRVSAYLMPSSYLAHLGYSSLVLTVAIIVWSFKYIMLARVFPAQGGMK